MGQAGKSRSRRKEESMNMKIHRQFSVDYREKDASIWIAAAHLCDDFHEIEIEVEVSLPEMVVHDARARFLRGPHEECRLVEQRLMQLRGLNINRDFRATVPSMFMGSEGCPNIFLLLAIALPPLAGVYYPYAQKQRGLPVGNFDDCLAHTIRNQTSDTAIKPLHSTFGD